MDADSPMFEYVVAFAAGFIMFAKLLHPAPEHLSSSKFVSSEALSVQDRSIRLDEIAVATRDVGAVGKDGVVF